MTHKVVYSPWLSYVGDDSGFDGDWTASDGRWVCDHALRELYDLGRNVARIRFFARATPDDRVHL